MYPPGVRPESDESDESDEYVDRESDGGEEWSDEQSFNRMADNLVILFCLTMAKPLVKRAPWPEDVRRKVRERVEMLIQRYKGNP